MWLWRLMGCWSGCDLLVDAEVLFDRGNALKGVIDFFLKAGDILDLFSEIVEIPANRFKFALNTCQLSAEVRDVVFSRHLAFDIGDITGDRGEAALDGREDAVERSLALLSSGSLQPYAGSIAYRSAGARMRRWFGCHAA